MLKSFPFHRQFDEADCGAACLQMVTHFHGMEYSLAYLKELTKTSKDGVSLLDVSDAADQLGMKTYGAKLSYETLQHDAPLPAIVFWQGYHFVVVFDIDDNRVVVGNPGAEDIVEIPKKEFIYNWIEDEEETKGVSLLLEPTAEFGQMESGETPSHASVFSFFIKQLAKFPKLWLQLLFGAIFLGIINGALPFLIKALVDGGIAAENLQLIYILMVGMIAFVATQAFGEFIRGAILNYLGINFHSRLLTDYVARLSRQPMKFFNDHSLGSIMQRISDSERLERFFHSSALFSFFSIFSLVILSGVLLYFNYKLFIVFILGTIAYVAYIFAFLRKRRSLNFRRFDIDAVANNYLLDIFSGVEDIKIYNADRQRRMQWEKHQAKLFKLNSEALKWEQWQKRGAFFINEFKNITILVMSAGFVIEGHLTFGGMLAIMFILGQLNAPVNNLVEFFKSYQEAAISLERMNEIEDELDAPANRKEITYQPKTKNISIENLSYQYGGAGSPVVLKNINLRIPYGKTVAIVGPNGSGKSTLMKLLLGILQPTVGTIKIGDVSLNGIDMNYWMSQVSAVLHNGHIFNDTIANNIALGQTQVDTERLRDVARQVNLLSYVDELPMHFNTVVGEGGGGMSQGLRQRLLLARAIYKDPDFILLDEAVNSLDAFNEMVIMENIRDNTIGKTMIFIAHRLGTISSADIIIVMEKGEIVEVGGHGELYDLGGAYYHFVRKQLELG